MQIDADNFATDAVLQKIRADRGYNYEDSITITPEKLPNYDEKVRGGVGGGGGVGDGRVSGAGWGEAGEERQRRGGAGGGGGGGGVSGAGWGEAGEERRRRERGPRQRRGEAGGVGER